MAFESIELLAEDQKLLKNMEISVAREMGARHIGDMLRQAFKHFALAERGEAKDKDMILTELRKALRELNEGIGEMFHSLGGNRSEARVLFDDAFKGLLNAGKMFGRGMKYDDINMVLKKPIEYNGVTTNLGEVLKNINWSQEQVNQLRNGRRLEQVEITDFSGMDLEDLTETLQDVLIESLPVQLQGKSMGAVRQHLADKIKNAATFAGCLEAGIDGGKRSVGDELQRNS